MSEDFSFGDLVIGAPSDVQIDVSAKVDALMGDFFKEAKIEYPIYVPSRGRSTLENYTIFQLKESKLDFFVVVEPQDYDAYVKHHGEKYILVMPKNNMGMSYVRNFCKDHSKTLGAKYHFQIDDNIKHFKILENGKKIEASAANVLAFMETIVSCYSNIGGAGISHSVFAFGDIKKSAKVNKQIFSCCLFSSENDLRWEVNIVEDTDYSIQMLNIGLCTILLAKVVMAKSATMAIKGGNTEISYSGNGRAMRSEGLVQKYPRWFKIVEQYGRAKISPSRIWRSFKHTPTER
jgi:hypothetical protein